MRNLLMIVLALSTELSFGQLFFKRHDAVAVSEENGLLAFPWAGGLNHGQFSNMDFDNDGRNDIFVFDKTGDAVHCFRMNEANELENAPRYREMFVNQHSIDRKRLHDWVLLRDFNGDGKSDIFTYSNGGMAIYRNDGNADTLVFTMITNKLLSNYGSGLINIYVSPVDLPAIMDVDNDGDMDVVTFSLFGTSAEYHENRSMQLYGTADSMSMVLSTPCWGDFEEDPSTVAANLDISCKGGTGMTDNSASPMSAAHSGFTMLGMDMEGDGDQDLVLSKVSFSTMNILTNDGSSVLAHIGSQDQSFPANLGSSDPINLYTFPAAFLVDANNDGKTDIVCSPYQEGNGHDHEGSYLYQNNSSLGFDVDLVKENFLQDEMIELGTSAYPVLLDYDNDGLMDLMVGNRGYFVSTGIYSSQLAYYRNTGTVDQPAFTLQTRNVANLAQLGLGNLVPTFGDIDGDGDADMIVGDADGLIHLFQNNAGVGAPCNFVLTEPGFQGIDISGQFATPCLYDVDGDDLLDLVIGERNGNLNFYQNQGSGTTPQYVQTDANWGGVDMRRNGLSFGYSAPFLFEDEGRLQLLVGSESGVTDLYDEITEVIGGSEQLVAQIGNGTGFSTSNETTPFGFTTRSGRNQYLIRAEELSAQGLSQGVFQRIALKTENGPSIMHAQFHLKMGMTELDELNGFVEGFPTVYYAASGLVNQGTVEYIAQTPIVWDGESNLVVEFCWYQTSGDPTSDLRVEYSNTPFISNAYASSNTFSGCGIAYIGSNSERPNFTFTVKPSFKKVSEFPVFEGERTAVALGDLNNDQLPELLIGNLAGGLAYYKGDTVGLTISGVKESAQVEYFELNLHPNPNTGNFVIEPKSAMAGRVEMKVYDMMGQLVWSGIGQNLIRSELDLTHLQNGLYLIDIRSETKMSTKRFVIQR